MFKYKRNLKHSFLFYLGMGSFALPYFFLGDNAFALHEHLMNPIGKLGGVVSYIVDRCFNYRISRGRRVVENAFGILSTRFRIFRREQDMEPEGVCFTFSKKTGYIYI